MFLTAEETQGVQIEVYNAIGQKIEGVVYCDTDSGMVGSVYSFGPSIERRYYAPAPLKLVNKETGLEIADELALAVCAAFKRARAADERKWIALEEKQNRAFREIERGVSPFLVRVTGIRPGNYLYDAFREALSDDNLGSGRYSVRYLD